MTGAGLVLVRTVLASTVEAVEEEDVEGTGPGFDGPAFVGAFKGGVLVGRRSSSEVSCCAGREVMPM